MVHAKLVNSPVSPSRNCCVPGSNGVLLHTLQSAKCGSHGVDTQGVQRMCHEHGILVDSPLELAGEIQQEAADKQPVPCGLLLTADDTQLRVDESQCLVCAL